MNVLCFLRGGVFNNFLEAEEPGIHVLKTYIGTGNHAGTLWYGSCRDGLYSLCVMDPLLCVMSSCNTTVAGKTTFAVQLNSS
jgi:hypothetical protein